MEGKTICIVLQHSEHHHQMNERFQRMKQSGQPINIVFKDWEQFEDFVNLKELVVALAPLIPSDLTKGFRLWTEGGNNAES